MSRALKAPRKQAKRGRPDRAHYLATYEQLLHYVRAFAAGHLNLVILVGERGLAKSRTLRAALPGEVCWIEGNATPFGIYEKLYRHRDQFVVIDDVDSLYADRSGVRLLKSLCQTEEEKAVAWHSDARRLERHGIPREFTTRSKTAIVCNDWKTLERNVAIYPAHYPFVPILFRIGDDHPPPSSAPRTASRDSGHPPRSEPSAHRPPAGW